MRNQPLSHYHYLGVQEQVVKQCPPRAYLRFLTGLAMREGGAAAELAWHACDGAVRLDFLLVTGAPPVAYVLPLSRRGE